MNRWPRHHAAAIAMCSRAEWLNRPMPLLTEPQLQPRATSADLCEEPAGRRSGSTGARSRAAGGVSKSGVLRALWHNAGRVIRSVRA